MKIRLLLFLILIVTGYSFSQNGFHIKNDHRKVVVPFRFINNLIIIPVNVNGTDLNFLLDTGVEETILFSLEESEEMVFSNLHKVMFKGIGANEPFEGLKSSKNKLTINGLYDNEHVIYIVLNQDINISSQVGVPVNGIIGYQFFKNYLVDINYNRKKITVYNHNSNKSFEKRLSDKYQKIPISIEGMKPYLNASIQMENNPENINAKLLIDIGNADALWLFKEKDHRIQVSDKSFDDFLGLGFSGTIYGKRCRIRKFAISDFTFENPIAAMPDSVVTTGMDMVENRLGSIGSEIMKRFSIVFDYPHNEMYLRKNDNFTLNFNYNMSGLEIQHQGLEWVTETYEQVNSAVSIDLTDNGNTKKDVKYKFVLKPSYSVFSVRKDSPSDLAGIKIGDEIKSINGRNSYNFTLQEINELLKSEEDKTVVIEVLRKNKPLKFKFKLKNMI